MALRGTTWLLKDTIDFSDGLEYAVCRSGNANLPFFTCDGVQYNEIDVEVSVSSGDSGLDFVHMNGGIVLVYDATRTQKWLNGKYRKITFTNEPNVGSAKLVQFLNRNGFQASSASQDYMVSGAQMISVADAIRRRKIGGKNMMKPGNFVQGKKISSGFVTTDAGSQYWSTTEAIPLEKGQNYVFSYVGTGYTNVSMMFIGNGDEIAYESIAAYVGVNAVQFTASTNQMYPNNIKAVYVHLQVESTNNSVISDVQLEKGTTATAYSEWMGLSFPDGMNTAIGTLTDTSDADATAGDILPGKTAYVNGAKVTGSYVPLDTSDADATASDILNGKTAYVDGTKVTGDYVPLDTSDADATAGDILTGKTAYVNGVKLTGSYNTSGHVSQQSYTEVRSSISMPAMSPGTSTVVTTITIPNDENWYITSAAFSSGYLATLYLNITGTTLTVLAVNDTQATIASSTISVQIDYKKVL